MNKQQIDFISSLDPEGQDGTVCQVMLQKNLNEVQFEKALVMLVRGLMQDKRSLHHENAAMSKFLKDRGLYCAEAVGLE